MSDPPQIARSTEESALATALPKSSARSRHAEDRAGSPHAHRFRTATAVLIGIAVAAIVVAATVAEGGRTRRPVVPWSDWAPTDGGTQGATEIAAHVAPFYRISAANQLAVVTVVNLESAAAAAAQAAAAANGTTAAPASGLQVAVKTSEASSTVALLSGNTIAYNLCGIGGRDCAIGVGAPSTNRLLLLRREALELALYTFKYIGATENVVAILPPGYTATTSTLTKSLPTSDSPTTGKPIDIAVLFVRQELQPFVDQPLADTLPEQFPPSIAQAAKAPEAGLVDQITAHGLFSERLQTAQDGSDLIVLDPLPPQ